MLWTRLNVVWDKISSSEKQKINLFVSSACPMHSLGLRVFRSTRALHVNLFWHSEIPKSIKDDSSYYRYNILFVETKNVKMNEKFSNIFWWRKYCRLCPKVVCLNLQYLWSTQRKDSIHAVRKRQISKSWRCWMSLWCLWSLKKSTPAWVGLQHPHPIEHWEGGWIVLSKMKYLPQTMGL